MKSNEIQQSKSRRENGKTHKSSIIFQNLNSQIAQSMLCFYAIKQFLKTPKGPLPNNFSQDRAQSKPIR